MSAEIKSQQQLDHFTRALRNLDQLWRFSGPPAAFWRTLLESQGLLSGARMAILLRKTTAEPDQWKKVGLWPTEIRETPGAQRFVRELDNLANGCTQQEFVVQSFNGDPLTPDHAVAVRLDPEAKQEMWVSAFYLPESSEAQAHNALRQVRLTSQMPGIYRSQRSANQSQVTLSHFSSVLDLMGLLNAQHRYLAVAMTFCNEIASRHKCDRVSLGWLEKNDYIRLQAISHTERFERKMEAVKDIEQTMEESLDQDETVRWPAAEGDTRITRDHERFADQYKVKFLCSVPLRLNGEPVAVLMCERNAEAFTDDEVQLLNLYSEMAVRRLSELKRHDRWFGARAATATRENLAKLVGVHHTWAKVVGVLVAIGLFVLFFGKMNYRVEAPFILRTDHIAMLSAPFNGYIDEVAVETGDPVKPKDILLKLDTRDLLLEEASSAADYDRYTREAEKARANNQLAEMRIAQAQTEQARVRLELVRYRLGQSSIGAPFAGVVVEGDLKKRIGAPVKQGDILFKVAQTDAMYVECNVNERDIHEVRDTATGEIAFASQPKLKFPIQIERIEPAAQAKDKGNIFLVRCRVQDDLKSWWRPGMSGVAKLNVGKRTFFWIISHRTVDFLRMYFWM